VEKREKRKKLRKIESGGRKVREKNSELDKELEREGEKEALVRERKERGEEREKKGDSIEER
jgi:hypothetical protein